jgi:hypothetical protein
LPYIETSGNSARRRRLGKIHTVDADKCILSIGRNIYPKIFSRHARTLLSFHEKVPDPGLAMGWQHSIFLRELQSRLNQTGGENSDQRVKKL